MLCVVLLVMIVRIALASKPRASALVIAPQRLAIASFLPRGLTAFSTVASSTAGGDDVIGTIDDVTNNNHKSKSLLETTLKPSEVVAELDRHIVGQQDAKRAVAIAMRNRWRRRQLPEDLRKEVTPRNVLLVGPTGCGKVCQWKLELGASLVVSPS